MKKVESQQTGLKTMIKRTLITEITHQGSTMVTRSNQKGNTHEDSGRMKLGRKIHQERLAQVPVIQTGNEKIQGE
jgi:hypothetical protein